MINQLILKRIFDLVVSFIALILLMPLFIITAVLIKIDSPGPVFFFYERIGKNSKPFYPFKFRTMAKDSMDRGGYKISENDERITKTGKFLRKFAIDELPQLFNVLKGEMSLVGPRPSFRYQVEKYNNFEKKRLDVLPGLAGWALIHGRNSLLWKERIKYDVWYVENWSFWLDIKIIIMSFYVIFIKQEGIYGKGGVNDDPFYSKRNDKNNNF
ncbi:MAG: sugar transferase [Candidatus Staskawiczbacteria bacterium]|nr:sugar transferase [Candidatus Staskawiczbacteria bacterium]